MDTIPDFRSAVWVALDCETTGFPPTAELIEIGAIAFHREDLLGEFVRLAKPTRRITPFIEQLTGITNKLLASAPQATEVIDEFLDWYPESAILVGHNLGFDLAILQNESIRLREEFDPVCVDTLMIARQMNVFSDNRLSTINESLFPGKRSQYHRARNDASVVRDFVNELLVGRLSSFRRFIQSASVAEILFTLNPRH